jgi:hypothetical protein
MARNQSFERRAREEVARIKGEEAAEKERKQERMRELAKEVRKHREAEAAEERRRETERDAKLRRNQKEQSQAEGERAKRAMFNSWVAQGGGPAEFEAVWPSMRLEQLKQRTLEADSAARESQRHQTHSHI